MKFVSTSRINALQGIKRIRDGSSSGQRNRQALSRSTKYLSGISKSSQSQHCHSAESKPHPSKFDESFDLIVVGSGCAGLTAAVVAGKHRLKVLVVEKTKFFGGTTAFSSGGIWIPNNHKQPELGINDDSFEKATTYIKDVLGDTYDPTKISQFLNKGPEVLKWVEKNISLEFKPIPLPDYFPERLGSSVARTLLPPSFDGRQLRGQVTIKDIRYVLQGYSAFGSMQVDPFQVDTLKSPLQQLQQFSNRRWSNMASRDRPPILWKGDFASQWKCSRGSTYKIRYRYEKCDVLERLACVAYDHNEWRYKGFKRWQ
jgi:hypothetical protein